ncbi:MAG TPA: Calx-beta domain-containing protein, partial [Vicinamibacteria bacterium]|nr:Calx-beta domain-containing protein [Vicinamibacteria bacterium]
ATEIAFTTGIFAISTGYPLPPAVVLTAADTDPAGPIDQLEKYEGMRVHVDSLTAVSPTQGTITESSATSVSNGVFYAVITGVARPFREPGVEEPDPLPPGAPAGVTRFDSNPERLRVDSDGQIGATALDVTSGAVVTGLTGPLDYSFRTYTILPDPGTPPSVSGNVMPTPIVAPGPGQFTVAAFNVERFFDTANDPATQDVVLNATAFQHRLNKVSLVIRNLMRSPDIVGLEEVENLSALQSIADKANSDAIAAGDPNPNYEAHLQEGNDIGGIDVGFLVKTSRVTVVDVAQEGKDATYINPNNNQPELLNDRPSLVLRAEVERPGAARFPVTVIVNHLRSLSGIDDPVDGNRVRTKRRAQAEFLADLVQARQTADPAEHIVLVGDFNAFQFSDGYVDVIGTVKGTPTPAGEVVLASDDLVNPDLTDLVETVPAEQRYSYSFDGNAQVIDHILVTGNLLGSFASAQFARVDADFPESLRNDPARPERVSDHDPVVATFNLPAAYSQTTVVSSANPSGFGQPVTFTATVVSAGSPATQGTVIFHEGTTVLAGPLALDASGQASFTTSGLGLGSHTITADYSGTTFATPSSGSVVQTVRAGLSVSDAFVKEGDVGTNRMSFVVTLTPAATQPVTVNAATVDGTATAGSDYVAGAASITFAPGVTRQTVNVAVKGDGVWEDDETLTLRLSNAVNAAISDGDGVGTILNDDPLPTVRVSDRAVREGDSGATPVAFQVRLSNASSRTVTVGYTTVDGSAKAGSDYVAATGSLTFPPGTVSQSVVVNVNGDPTREPNEFFFVQASNATNAAIAYGRGIAIILNDDRSP